MRLYTLFSIILFGMLSCTKESLREVQFIKLQEGHIQPKVAVDTEGIVHILSYKGEAGAGDIYYGTILPGDTTISHMVRVNDLPGAAIAAGTIRGAQLAVGKDGTVHVLWNGSGETRSLAEDSTALFPLLYSRKMPGETSFSKARNIISKAWGLDGGSSIAANDHGGVFIAWHAPLPGKKGEENRRVWLSISKDNGENFSEEDIISDSSHGVCGCCGLQLHNGPEGLYTLYRNVDGNGGRNIHLISLGKDGKEAKDILADHWPIDGCPMSSSTLFSAEKGVFGAWEAEKKITFAKVSGTDLELKSPQTQNEGSRHPSIVSLEDHIMLVWSEGTGWNKGGDAAWEIIGPSGKTINSGKMKGAVPVWGFATAFARDNGFSIIY